MTKYQYDYLLFILLYPFVYKNLNRQILYLFLCLLNFIQFLRKIDHLFFLLNQLSEESILEKPLNLCVFHIIVKYL